MFSRIFVSMFHLRNLPSALAVYMYILSCEKSRSQMLLPSRIKSPYFRWGSRFQISKVPSLWPDANRLELFDRAMAETGDSTFRSKIMSSNSPVAIFQTTVFPLEYPA